MQYPNVNWKAMAVLAETGVTGQPQISPLQHLTAHKLADIATMSNPGGCSLQVLFRFQRRFAAAVSLPRPLSVASYTSGNR